MPTWIKRGDYAALPILLQKHLKALKYHAFGLAGSAKNCFGQLEKISDVARRSTLGLLDKDRYGRIKN